jgi:glucokinase
MVRSIVGVDLGGTKAALARYDAATWTFEEREKFLTEAGRGFDDVLDRVVQHIARFRRPDTVAVGIGIPGLVRRSDGVLLNAPNIPGSAGVPLKKILEDRVKLPVFLENDAHCFALAEALRGAGKGHDVVIGVTFGTGVGGGIVLQGKLFRGGHGFAGEFGHTLLTPGNVPYEAADKRGDVEQFLSGRALGKRCEVAKRPEEYLEGEVCAFLRPEVFREVAWFVTNLLYSFDPDIVVFGGSTGRALKPHLKEISDELRAWLVPHTPLPLLATAALEDAGTLGAALLCDER